MTLKFKKFVMTGICCLLLLAIGITLLARPSYAQVGETMKQTIIATQSGSSWTEEETAAYERQQQEKSYKFVIPNGFSDESTYSNSTTKMDAVSFITELNPFEMSTEWKGMTVEQRLQASNIPDDLIAELSTDEIILFIMNYNFLCDLHMCDTIQAGFDQLKSQYNGPNALFQRQDSGKRLLQLYKSVDLDELYENDRFSIIRLNLLEVLLAQTEMLQLLSNDEAHELIIACSDKAQQMYLEPGRYGVATTLYLGLRCLYVHDPYVKQLIDDSLALKKFVETSSLNLDDIDDETVGKLTVYIQEQYIKGE